MRAIINDANTAIISSVIKIATMRFKNAKAIINAMSMRSAIGHVF